MHSASYDVGYRVGLIAGPIILIFILVAAFVGYSISLVQYTRSRRGGWLAALIVSFLPLAGLFGIMLVGLGITLLRELGSASVGHSQTANSSSQKSSPLTGHQFDYTLQVPDLDEWSIDSKIAPFDRVISHRDIYFGVIAEHIGLGDAESLLKAAQANITTATEKCTFGKATPITIAGLPWLTFDVTAKLPNLTSEFKYRYYVYSDAKHSIQLLAWSSPAMLDKNAATIDQIARSFRFGND
ncbi:MAG TPA: hypothetical protein VIM48_11410 [Chthoniobacterales bacterium]